MPLRQRRRRSFTGGFSSVSPAPDFPAPDGNPEARWLHERSTAGPFAGGHHMGLQKELATLAARQAPIRIVHYDGRTETGRLTRVSQDGGSLALHLSEHRTSKKGGRATNVREDRPIHIVPAMAESSRSKAELTLSFSPQDGGEHGCTIHIDTVL